MHPFPYIKELADIEKITGFNDIAKIMNFVYTIVPWTLTPYTELITLAGIKPLYKKFKMKEAGGWCGLNAEFFKWIIEGYRQLDPCNIHVSSYNYGIAELKFTHIAIAVEIDKMEFLFDPYFNRYYVHKDGFPLQLEDLLFLIRERKTDKYKTVFLDSSKPAFTEDGVSFDFYPKELLKDILDFFESTGFSKTMKKIFNDTNPDLLMLLKIPD